VENLFQRLQQKVEEVKNDSGKNSEVLEKVVSLLRREVEYYDWVGFYLADSEEEELILGPYDGEPTSPSTNTGTTISDLTFGLQER